MIRILTILLFLSLAGCNTAQISDTSETRLSSEELSTLLVGNVVVLQQGSKMSYSNDGIYEWISTTEHDRGVYTIRDDKVCVDFDDGNARCDYYQKSDAGYVVVDKNDKVGIVASIEKITPEEPVNQ